MDLSGKRLPLGLQALRTMAWESRPAAQPHALSHPPCDRLTLDNSSAATASRGRINHLLRPDKANPGDDSHETGQEAAPYCNHQSASYRFTLEATRC